MIRKSFRFNPDENCLIKITRCETTGEDMNKVGLVMDESYAGCSAVFRKPFVLKEGEKFKMELGKIHNLTGYVQWVNNFNKVFLIAGIYIEPIK
ncbi:MAG: hypothetical protein ABIH89_00900 [Elusimicrobiota bacterium]